MYGDIDQIKMKLIPLWLLMCLHPFTYCILSVNSHVAADISPEEDQQRHLWKSR